MQTATCPVCDRGKIPVELDFHPYADELDCPYCGGKAHFDLEDPEDARTLAALRKIDTNDPGFQERVSELALERAARLAERDDR